MNAPLREQKRREVCFVAPGEVVVRDAERPELGWGQYLIETECSVVSSGTEQAILRGSEDWAPLPYVPGYGSVGRVLECGPGATQFVAGDQVFTHGEHASLAASRYVVVGVPRALHPARAVMARLASIALTALRVADAEYGDHVAVLGLGAIGNFAAQLFQRAGCEIIAIDPSERRRDIARACGIEVVLHPDEADDAAVARLTQGERCASVIDATGLPAVIERAPRLARPLGDLVLLGTPRQPHHSDVTPLLRSVHMMDSLTIKGALEWRFPAQASPNFRYPHSVERHSRQMLDAIARGKLVVEPLLTHVIRPERAAEAYECLRSRPEEWLGVVFDWRA